jgi:hypothetical protein
MRKISLTILLTALILFSFCGMEKGKDSDGDGLSDRQELLFKTDPENPDTDGDGIPDGLDPQPLPDSPKIFIKSGSAKHSPSSDMICVFLYITLENCPVKENIEKNIILSTSLGNFEPLKKEGEMSYSTAVCTEQTAFFASVYAEYDDPSDIFPPVISKIKVAFSIEDFLPHPGNNTKPYVNSGNIEGFIRIFAIEGESAGSTDYPPLPFEGAYVMVERNGFRWTGFTNEDGYADFIDDRLDGQVTVTAGAEGYRYFTEYGVNSENISIGIFPVDPLPAEKGIKQGGLTGRVIGFHGEGGLPSFPENMVEPTFKKVNIGIVQVSLKNVPLSSISMGNVLVPGKDVIPIPTNIVFDSEDQSNFLLEGLNQGDYLLFVLAGEAEDMLPLLTDPYKLKFHPIAMGMKKVTVKAGKITELAEPLVLNIDIRPEPGTFANVYLGGFPVDSLTGIDLPNGLVFGVSDTNGLGYIFTLVDGSYNFSGFSNPVLLRFPSNDHPAVKELGMNFTNLAVGLASREAYNGADVPGISTAIKSPVSPGDDIFFNSKDAWLDIPEIIEPDPPQDRKKSDTPGGVLTGGIIKWKPVQKPANPDLYAVRFNYMIPPPENTIYKGYTIGSPRSHCLWEIFVPGNMTEIVLPDISDAPGYPVLVNPAPNEGDTSTIYHYGKENLEIELNAYLLGGAGKDFDYDNDFLYLDINLHAIDVSQDSFIFRMY